MNMKKKYCILIAIAIGILAGIITEKAFAIERKEESKYFSCTVQETAYLDINEHARAIRGYISNMKVGSLFYIDVKIEKHNDDIWSFNAQNDKHSWRVHKWTEDQWELPTLKDVDEIEVSDNDSGISFRRVWRNDWIGTMYEIYNYTGNVSIFSVALKCTS